jgi:hypothetical protein
VSKASKARAEVGSGLLLLETCSELLTHALKSKHWAASERAMLDWLGGPVLCMVSDALQTVLDGKSPDAPAPGQRPPGACATVGASRPRPGRFPQRRLAARSLPGASLYPVCAARAIRRAGAARAYRRLWALGPGRTERRDETRDALRGAPRTQKPRTARLWRSARDPGQSSPQPACGGPVHRPGLTVLGAR